MWTSASGQSCWMMPVMNVPWPASKSSVPLSSSSNSSSSSIAPGRRVLQPRRVQAGARQVRVLDGAARSPSTVRSPVSRISTWGACGRPSASGCGSHAGGGAGSDVVFSTGPIVGLHDVGREHHPAGEVRLAADRAARARPGCRARRGSARRRRRPRAARRAPRCTGATLQRRSPWIVDRILVGHADGDEPAGAALATGAISPAWRSSYLAIAASAARERLGGRRRRRRPPSPGGRARARRGRRRRTRCARRTNTSARRPEPLGVIDDHALVAHGCPPSACAPRRGAIAASPVRHRSTLDVNVIRVDFDR